MTNEKVIHFNKDDYNRLILTIGLDQDDLRKKFLQPGGGIAYDKSLGDFVQPGSANWKPAKLVKDGAAAFGGSVLEKLGGVDDEWTATRKSLRDISDVFETCDDLATMSAEDFRKKYPDFDSGGWTSGGGNTGNGGSNTGNTGNTGSNTGGNTGGKPGN